MTEPERQKVDVLERGDVYFVYRPKVQQEEVEGMQDIQRSYMILSPHGKDIYRLIVLGQKKLPEVGDGGQKYWGFVEKIGHDPREMQDELQREEYVTKTRGQRVRPAARPAGEGVYAIVRHGDHTHLAYALELPKQGGEVQDALNLEAEASYIVSVKNPEASSPPQVGLRGEQKPELPKHLMEKFRGRRFADAEPDLLDCEGTELLLIGAREDPEHELGIKLNPQEETEDTAEIFTDLRLAKSQHPTAPLFKGEWQ